MRTQFVGARSNYDKKKGDSSGKEVCIHNYYDFNKQFGKPSYILRIKDADTRHKVAEYGIAIANNNKVGYSQANRYSLLEELKRVKKPSKIKNLVECDCSSFVGAIMYLLGVKFNTWTSTRTLNTDFKSAMKNAKIEYQVIEYKSQSQLKKGDILNNPNHHVVVVI